jgi:hypothetical protein
MAQTSSLKKPSVSSNYAQKELDKAEKEFDKFSEEIKDLTLDRLNAAPKLETEPQTKISNKQAEVTDGLWLKPNRTVGSKEKFNEKYRKEYEHAKEYVRFIAENKEIIGESVTLWTKKFPGMPAEEWIVPVNKIVWGPRYLAERIKDCSYHRMHMQQAATSQDSVGTFYGSMVVDNIVQRLDAIPVSEKKSIFMGASGF